MNGLDLAVLVALGLAALGGFRLGFIRRATGWLGAVVGLAIAFAVLPVILERYESDGGPRLLLLAATVLLVGALLGQALGIYAASSLRWALPSALKGADRVVGALLGAALLLLGVWLLVPVMKAIPTWPSEQAGGSTIVDLIEDALPDAPDALRQVGATLADIAPPTVFADPSAVPDVPPPPEQSALSAETTSAVTSSVVRVSGVACEFLQQGSGFVAEAGVVITNAHVVAGHESTTVELPGGGSHEALLVHFDPDLDLALLEVPGLSAPALELAPPIGAEAPTAGEEGIVAGYPGGGRLELSPYLLADRVIARGSDIYGARTVLRDVLVLATELEPGDSGSPVLNSAGVVTGLAFAVARDKEAVAYALSEAELRDALGAPRAPTSSGACLSVSRPR